MLRRDRAVVATCLSALVVLAWAYMLWLAADMQMGGMDMTGFRMIPASSGLMMPVTAPWQAIEFWLVFVMWAVMMVGMMIPSAAPLILIYTRVARQAATLRQPFAASAWFASGYLLTSISFAFIATVASGCGARGFALAHDGEHQPHLPAALTLIAVGLYQWTPLKDACLRECQSPLQFIQRHGGFRADPIGSLALGVRHGVYCVDCCWVLMALLFVGGVMNVLWIGLIMIFVLMEKLVPAGRLISRVSGAGFLAAGVWLITRSL